MSFVNPWALFGLFGALAPIIIHLIHQRRPRRHDFAAIELVLRSVKRVQRRWRLRRFLLLTARVLLLAGLSLAAAGPIWGEDRAQLLRRGGPRRVAIVMDASLSTRARFGSRSAFSRIVSQARAQVEGLGPEDRALLYVAGAAEPLPISRPTADRAALLAAIDAVQPSYAYADLAAAVSAAAAALGRSPGAQGTPATSADGLVVLLSDLARSGLTGPAKLELPGLNKRAQLEVIDVLDGVVDGPRKNRAVTRLSYAALPGQQARTLQFSARVQSFEPTAKGRKPTPVAIDLKLKDRDLATGLVEVVPGTIVDKRMRHAFAREGSFGVHVALEADALMEDNLRFAQAEVQRSVRALIVDGAPSGLPKADEVFYLERALAAGAGDQPPARVIAIDDLHRAKLSDFEVVILAGVDKLESGDARHLLRFVERGGGLLISAGPGLDADRYNRGLGPILPRPIRGLLRLDTEDLEDTHLTRPQLTHPVLTAFEGQASQGLLSTKVWGYLQFEAAPEDQDSQTLLSLQSGGPALLLSERHRGRVAVLATSIDRDLSDLPIRPAFVPLMRRLVLYLGGGLRERVQEQPLVGQRHSLELPPGVQQVTVTDPSGATQDYPVKRDATRLQLGLLRRPGSYRVQAELRDGGEPIELDSFVVNVDSRESDLSPLTAEQASELLVGGRQGLAHLSPGLRLARTQRQLASGFLALMLLAFLLEGLLTAHRLPPTHDTPDPGPQR